MQNIGITLKPKHHAVIHMLVNQLTLGAARFTATWLDEGLNMKAKQVGSTSHCGQSWHARFLAQIEWVLGRM